MLTKKGAVFLVYVLTLCTRVFITVVLADMSGRVAALMGARKWTEMFSGQAMFGLVALGAAGTTALMKFLEKQVALDVRSVLFEHLKQRYLDEATVRYYHQDLPDAAARLTADLEDFSSELVHLVGHFMKPVIDIAHLSAVLFRRIGGINLGVFYAFFYVSNVALKRVRARALLKPLKACAMERTKLQSELRSSLTGLHTYREQIAMQKGTAHELASVDAKFEQIAAETQLENMQYGFVDLVNSYTLKYGGMMCAFSILTPKGYMDPSQSGEALTAFFFGNSSLLGSLASAVKDLADSFSRLPKVRGLADRVFELEDRMRAVDASGRNRRSSHITVDASNQLLSLQHVNIAPPAPLPAHGDVADAADAEPVAAEPDVLIRDLSLELRPGDHTVIRGANGVGTCSFRPCFPSPLLLS